MAADKRFIKDGGQLTTTAGLAGKILELEGKDSDNKPTTHYAGVALLVQATKEALPGPNSGKTVVKSVASLADLAGLDQNALCIGAIARVRNAPNQELIRDEQGLLSVWPDGSFTGPKLPARWVEEGSQEAQNAGVEVFNELANYYPLGAAVVYLLNGVAQVFTAKPEDGITRVPPALMPAPTGEPSDQNWTPAAPSLGASLSARVTRAAAINAAAEETVTDGFWYRVARTGKPEVQFRGTSENTYDLDHALQYNSALGKWEQGAYDLIGDVFAVGESSNTGGGVPFVPYTLNQLGTHPALGTQKQFNDYILGLLSRGVSAPPAPTQAQVDDIGNTFSHAIVSGYTTAGDYELSVGGAYSAWSTAYVQNGRVYFPSLIEAYGVGQVSSRVAASGARPAGLAVSNTTAFTGTSGTTPTQLSAPSNAQAVASGQGALNVTASSVANASGYKLFRSATQNGTYTQVGGSLSTPAYLDSGLTASTAYYYKWQTVGNGTTYTDSAQGAFFSGTTAAAGTTPTAPGQVISVTATPGNGKVTLNAPAPANNGAAITNYQINYRSGTGGPYSTFGLVPSLPADVTGLTNGVSYQFTTAAINSAGIGPVSEPVSTTPVSGTGPTVTATFAATSYTQGQTASVFVQAGATTTKLELLEDDVVKTTKTTAPFTGLTWVTGAGAANRVIKVRATDSGGGTIYRIPGTLSVVDPALVDSDLQINPSTGVFKWKVPAGVTAADRKMRLLSTTIVAPDYTPPGPDVVRYFVAADYPEGIVSADGTSIDSITSKYGMPGSFRRASGGGGVGTSIVSNAFGTGKPGINFEGGSTLTIPSFPATGDFYMVVVGKFSANAGFQSHLCNNMVTGGDPAIFGSQKYAGSLIAFPDPGQLVVAYPGANVPFVMEVCRVGTTTKMWLATPSQPFSDTPVATGTAVATPITSMVYGSAFEGPSGLQAVLAVWTLWAREPTAPEQATLRALLAKYLTA